MNKPLVVGHMTDTEMTEMQRLAAQYQQIMMNRAAVDQQLVDHGMALKESANRIENAHKLEHGHNYLFAKNGEIHRMIPEQPPITEKHLQ